MAQFKSLSINNFSFAERELFSTADCLARFIAQLGRCSKEIDMQQLISNLYASVKDIKIAHEALHYAMLYFAEWGFKPQFTEKSLCSTNTGKCVTLVRNESNKDKWDVFVDDKQVGFEGNYDVALSRYFSEIYHSHF